MKETQAWIPVDLIKRIEQDPIRTYLLLKMLVEQYAPIKDTETMDGQAADYVIVGMLDEMKRQYPKIKKVEKPKPEEIN